MNSMWSEEDYWLKSKLYIRRAQASDSEDNLYPFWMALAMEFIARASLSKVHPVLNADPRQVENIYFSLGLGDIGNPKTIPLHAVFQRCVAVVDGFEENHKSFCDSVGVQRNEELHTGSLPFADLKLQEWLQRCYEVLDIFTRHLGKSLKELLGTAEGEAALELLKSSKEGLETSVKQKIADRKREFGVRSEDEKEQLVSEARARVLSEKKGKDLGEVVECPSCSSGGLVTGRPVRRSKPYYEDGYLFEEVTAWTESFVCYACELKLTNASQIRWSGIEPQFTDIVETDLHEQQQFEYYDEYMNE